MDSDLHDRRRADPTSGPVDLVRFAVEGGAHAIIALRVSSCWIGETTWTNSRKTCHTLFGTAVILGVPSR